MGLYYSPGEQQLIFHVILKAFRSATLILLTLLNQVL